MRLPGGIPVQPCICGGFPDIWATNSTGGLDSRIGVQNVSFPQKGWFGGLVVCIGGFTSTLGKNKGFNSKSKPSIQTTNQGILGTPKKPKKGWLKGKPKVQLFVHLGCVLDGLQGIETTVRVPVWPVLLFVVSPHRSDRWVLGPFQRVSRRSLRSSRSSFLQEGEVPLLGKNQPSLTHAHPCMRRSTAVANS